MYFNNIVDAYYFMQNEFYKSANKNGGIEENFINDISKDVFGPFDKKLNKTNTVYYYEKAKQKEEIYLLYYNQFLNSDHLTLNPDNDSHKYGFCENYFSIKLIKNNNINQRTCLLCSKGIEAGYSEVKIHKCKSDKILTEKGHFEYCREHLPFLSCLD